MITLLLHLLRLLLVLCGSHRHLALEKLALRHQLAVYKRTVARPRLRTADRLFWVGLTKVWAGWRQSLVLVTPDTVLRWQRRRFRQYWTGLSSSPGGRPRIDAELRALVARKAETNPLWGAPRIHGELMKLGIKVAERTVSRLLPKRRTPPSQTWRTFLVNHVLTAPHSPWQNPFAERLIGSIRRECVDHVVVLGERHLRRILARYFEYYHRARTHLSLDKDAPDLRPVELPELGRIVEIPEVGGLHHRYIRRAA